MADIVAESIGKSFVSFQEAPLDKRTLYQTKAEFLNADENKYVETFVSFPPPGHTEIITKRFIGQKVVIQADPENNGKPQEYWFRNGITNADLVKYDSYEWENLEPGTGGGSGGGGNGGGIALNGDPLQVVKGNGSLDPGFIQFAYTFPPEISAKLSYIPSANTGYTIKYSSDRLQVSIQAEKTCNWGSPSQGILMFLAVGYRANVNENFSFPYGWKYAQFNYSP